MNDEAQQFGQQMHAADGPGPQPPTQGVGPSPQPTGLAVPPASAPQSWMPHATVENAAGYVLVIGDIGVTSDTIVTPNGNAALAGSQWILSDRTVSTRVIPTWAIVMAIVFSFFFLLGLLFLLVKETRITGYVEVSVRSGQLWHMTQLPARSANDVPTYRWLVGQAQSMATAAGHTMPPQQG